MFEGEKESGSKTLEGFTNGIKPKTERWPHFNFDSVLKEEEYWNIQYDELNKDKYSKK